MGNSIRLLYFWIFTVDGGESWGWLSSHAPAKSSEDIKKFMRELHYVHPDLENLLSYFLQKIPPNVHAQGWIQKSCSGGEIQ